MKYLAAYVLLSMGGNKSPSAKDIENVLGSVGLDVDMEEANKVVKALSEKSVDEIITSGKEKMASVPTGTSVAASTAAAVAAPVAAAAPEPEKKKEEEKEESDDDMGFGLFD